MDNTKTKNEEVKPVSFLQTHMEIKPKNMITATRNHLKPSESQGHKPSDLIRPTKNDNNFGF